ncbi:hypothetical protein CNMCM7691_005096 [Aspergillus felis]|uniref:Uncharacterized protein n=1 Tax=Aspergillus felis TaxID=1287682 RepID=A0A8H6R366_9EURO|nr:hypothetical protein CNMCM7691_005096 [Aspergillus felis]
MSYEMNHHTPAMVQQVTTPSRSRGISKWWPISLFIFAVVFFIIGGGLAGAWNSRGYSCDFYSCLDDYDGEFYGAIACFAIGGILKITGWILLIIYLVKRRRLPASAVTYVNPPYAAQRQATFFGGPQLSPMTPASPPAPVYTSAPSSNIGVKYCGNCGTAVGTPFCTQCGSKI